MPDTHDVAPLRPTAEPPTDVQLTQIRTRSRRLAQIPFEPHCHADGCIPCALVQSAADVQWLLEQLASATARAKQAETITARVTDRMREYDQHGSGTVNVRQVLNLLSPTWPDGNYQATPAGGDHG